MNFWRGMSSINHQHSFPYSVRSDKCVNKNVNSYSEGRRKKNSSASTAVAKKCTDFYANILLPWSKPLHCAHIATIMIPPFRPCLTDQFREKYKFTDLNVEGEIWFAFAVTSSIAWWSLWRWPWVKWWWCSMRWWWCLMRGWRCAVWWWSSMWCRWCLMWCVMGWWRKWWSAWTTTTRNPAVVWEVWSSNTGRAVAMVIAVRLDRATVVLKRVVRLSIMRWKSRTGNLFGWHIPWWWQSTVLGFGWCRAASTLWQRLATLLGLGRCRTTLQQGLRAAAWLRRMPDIFLPMGVVGQAW